MTPENNMRYRRLRFRSRLRGTAEVGIILCKFSDEHLHNLDANLVDSYEELLQANDIDIFNWLAWPGNAPRIFNQIIKRILSSVQNTPSD